MVKLEVRKLNCSLRSRTQEYVLHGVMFQRGLYGEVLRPLSIQHVYGEVMLAQFDAGLLNGQTVVNIELHG